jgi:hypothetical protein
VTRVAFQYEPQSSSAKILAKMTCACSIGAPMHVVIVAYSNLIASVIEHRHEAYNKGPCRASSHGRAHHLAAGRIGRVFHFKQFKVGTGLPTQGCVCCANQMDAYIYENPTH